MGIVPRSRALYLANYAKLLSCSAKLSNILLIYASSWSRCAIVICAYLSISLGSRLLISSSGGRLGVTIAAGLTNSVLHIASNVLSFALFLPSFAVQIVFWGIGGLDLAESALVDRSWSFISAVRLSDTAFVVWSMICVHLRYISIIAVSAKHCKHQ